MSDKLTVPVSVKAQAGDNSVIVSWNAVEGADGYYLRFYRSSEPENCIKKRSAHGERKLILGLANGTEYLVSVSPYRYIKGKEQEGEASSAVAFTPISETLKAQRTICLNVGETAQVEWESANKKPLVHFTSDNEAVATVGGGGIISAVSEGIAYITVFSKTEEFSAKVIVGRKQPEASGKAVVMLTGELMCGAAQQRAAVRKILDFHECFRNVREILNTADLAIGVLETTCHDSTPYEYEQLTTDTGSPNCNSPSTFISAAAGAGFDVLSTAANRSSMRIREGLNATADAIKRLGMDNLGTLAGGNPVYRKVNGIRIALISCTMVFNSNDKELCGLSDEILGIYSREYFEKLVRQARKSGAEFIIAVQHWGKSNSRTVTKQQREEARFMADCGADLIVGAHPHIIQEIESITASDGREVLCAYSLGNFISAQTEFEENRDSVIIRAELTRKVSGISACVSYIPCCSADTDHGVTVRPVYPAYSDDSVEALSRIKKSMGKVIEPYAHKPLIALSGSVILERIFSIRNRFRVDKNAMLLSQLTACSGSGVQGGDTVGALKLDLEKSLPEYLKTCGADYLAVDFYTAAAVSCYKLGDNRYTGSKRFLESEFYRSHESEFKRIKPSFSEKLWKPAIKQYADAVKAAFPKDRVILFRQYFSEHYAEGAELRIIPLRKSLNAQIRAMEEYFISLVDPAVVNLSGYYFTVGSAPSDYEHEYFTDAAHAAESIISDNRRCVSVPDKNLWYDRVLRYYNSMTARAFQGWMLDMHSAADMIIAYTNREFAATHRERLLSLKRMGESQLTEVGTFFAEDTNAVDIINAANIIQAVLSGDMSQPYEFYALAFREKFNILKIVAKLLSIEVGAPVSVTSTERVFLLRSKPQQLKQYLRTLNTAAVDIWGSDISKEIINRCANVEIDKYIYKQCPMLSYEALITVDVPQDISKFGGNNWRRRSMADAFMRNGLFTLSQSSAKWLVIDLYDTICEMNEFMGGLFEVDEFIMGTDFYKEIEPQCTPCYLFEKRNMQYCHQALTRFTKDIAERYGKNIILVRADLKDKFITLDDRLQPMDDDPMLSLKRKFITLCEDMFIQFTGCCVVDVSKHFYSSDRYPGGGADIVHYEEEFYRLAAEYISRIINGDTCRLFDKADENYISLRDLRLERD